MGRLLATTRAGNWWLSKLPPLCAVGYAAIAVQDLAPAVGSYALGGVLASLCVVAWFAHVVNDLCDRDEDRQSGKPNRLEGVPAWQGVALAAALAALALAIPFVLFDGDMATPAWIAADMLIFALYSVRPVRLKTRGWWAVVADSAGAHVVPSTA